MHLLFTNLPWLRDSEKTLRSSSQAATCQHAYLTHSEGFTMSFLMLSYVKQRSNECIFFQFFGLNRSKIELKLTVLVEGWQPLCVLDQYCFEIFLTHGYSVKINV